MNFLFVAYTLIWVLLFAYLFSIAKRQKKVQDDLARMQQKLERR
jgi:CcmD family protein